MYTEQTFPFQGRSRDITRKDQTKAPDHCASRLTFSSFPNLSVLSPLLPHLLHFSGSQETMRPSGSPEIEVLFPLGFNVLLPPHYLYIDREASLVTVYHPVLVASKRTGNLCSTYRIRHASSIFPTEGHRSVTTRGKSRSSRAWAAQYPHGMLG